MKIWESENKNYEQQYRKLG